jgi:DNA repair photolyase
MALRWALAETEEKGTLFPDERVAERHVGKGAYAGMEFLHVNARTIINTVPPESVVPFRHTINPYRGCSHACVYCFARPTHDYLGLGIGEDFERKIVVKVNAVERLRAELRSPKWSGDHIAMGTNTDPYQHAEGKYHLTRGIVETLSAARNPFSILTKSTLVLRDAALLAAASERTDVAVSFSIGTLDRDVWKLTEPGTPPPDRRVEALRRLSDLGIHCGVLVAPVLPGLSDGEAQLTEVVEACAAAGAASIAGVALHLRGPLRGHYLDWLARARPDLVRLHRGRFRRGAYQEDAERERVEGIVGAAARRCGVTGRDRYRGRGRGTRRAGDGDGDGTPGEATPVKVSRQERRPESQADSAGGQLSLL